MSSGDITYGTRTLLANIDRLDSLAIGEARTFGEILGAGEIGINIRLFVPITSTAVGTYDLYVVESQEGTEWTDGIDPTSTTTDVADLISDSKLIKSADATFVTTNREQAQFHVQLSMLSLAKSVGLVLVNNADQIIPASGSDGDFVTYKVS